ncbi:MAG: T9SS type A sorting domain-containing protein [Bacteroidota bacterium]
MKKSLLYFFIIFLSANVVNLHGATYYSRASGNWNANASWSTASCGGAAAAAFPIAGDDVIICNTHTIAVNVNAACATVSLQGSGRLNFNNNSITLTVTGNVTMAGTSQITGNNNNRIMNIGGTFNVSAGSTVNLGEIQLNLTGVATIDGTMTCIDNTGTKNFNSDFNISSTGTLSYTDNETYNIAGNLNITNGGTINGASTGIIAVTGAFNVLTGTGAASIGRVSLTILGATTVNGTLQFANSGTGNKSFRAITVSATGTWDNTVGEDPRINGNIVNNGSWYGNTGGTADYQFGRDLAGSYTISGNAVVFSRLSIEDATTITNLGTVILDGNVEPGIRNRNGNGNATFNNGNGTAAAVLYLQTTGGSDAVDPPGNNLTFNASFNNNTVHYTRGGNQDIRIPDDACYYNLVCAISGTKSIQAGTTGIKNLLTIQDDAIVDVGTRTLADGCGGSAGLTMTGNSQLIISKCTSTVPELTGTYTLTGGTIELDGACAQVLRGGVAYNNLIFSSSNSVNLTGITTINGDITFSNSSFISGNSAFVMDCSKTLTYSSTGSSTLTAGQNISIGNYSQSSGTLIDNGINITVCGSSWDRSAGTFTATGRAIFNSSTTVSGAATTTFRNVTINATKTLIGHATNMGVSGADFTNNGTYTHNSGTVTFSGTTSILGTSITAFNNLTISAGTLTGHSTNVNIEGSWTNNSAFTHNSSKITFTGGSAQSLAGTATTTFFNIEVNKSPGTILTQTATTATVNNLLTMTEGIFDIVTRTLNGGGAFTATGGDLQLAKITTVPELTGTYSISGGTVTLDGAGAQTLRTSTAGGSTYYNLAFGTSGVKTITNLLTINGDVTVSGSATLTANSAFTQASAKTFNYNSSGNTTMTAATNFTTGSYSQTAGTFNINSNNMTVTGGTWNKSAGTFTTTGRVIFQGSTVQTFTHDANNFNNVTINNSNGLQLNNDISITTNLTFTSGNIVTGTSKVILTANATTVTGAAQGVGFVEGNFQKYISTSPKTFEVGSGGNYAPVNFTFASITTAGNLICSTTSGDHSDIQASDIDPNKSVNRYWTIDYSTLVITTYGATFNYSSAEVDAIADPSVFGSQRYDAISWSNLTMSGVPTSTAAVITGASGTTSRVHIIGERFNPNGLYNAVTGAMNWNNIANWIRYRTGTITSVAGNAVVTGAGTTFTTQIAPGDVLLSQTAPGTALGTVQSVDNDGQITLTAGATASVAGASFGIRALPGVNDEVNIGNPFIATAAVTVTLDVDASIYKLIFTRMNYSNSLTHSGANALTLSNNVDLKQPNNANTNTWNIDAGTATVAGNVTIGSNDGTASRIARTNITTGTLSVGTNLVYSNTTAANSVLNMSGACTLNLSGNVTLTNSASAYGTFTPGASSTVNYNRTTNTGSPQTVNLTTTAPAVTYANLHLNNTTTVGATISVSITTTNVTGNFRVQSGKFTYGGALSITGNGTKTFEVANGATFEMTASSNPPTGFGTFTFGATSNTQYHQSIARNITVRTYGHLQVQPTGNVTHTFQAGTTTVQGNLDLGNGTNTSTAAMTGASIISVTGDITLYINNTFTHAGTTATPAVNISGNWVNNGGTFTPSTKTVNFNGTGTQEINGTATSQTFYDITIAKTAGTTLSAGGSTTTLTTNNITINTGTFNAPATLNITSTTNAVATLIGGIFNGNASLINITGNWVNNGGTFNGGTSTLTFTGGNARQINGTAVSQTFNNIVIDKSNVTVSTGGSTTTITSGNFTLSNGNFTAPATMNVTGTFFINGNSGGDTYTGGTNTNIGGNITYDAGTLTWGTNVTLNGTSAQTISGASTIPNFTNFILNNTYASTAVTLSTPINVDGVFTLTDGHLVTDATNTLTLGTAASVTLNAPVTQDSSFVKGPMVHSKSSTGSETKIFPVGKSNELHRSDLIVNHSTTGATTYTGEYFYASAEALGWTLPAIIDKVSEIGYWNVNKGGTGTVSTGAIKLYYIALDAVVDPTNLAIAKGNAAAWLDIGGSPGSGAPTGNITSSISFTTFSFFSLANRSGGINPLPIELLSFDAKPNDAVVDLKWTTATEINNDYFTIERSKDGVIFETVSIVDGAGTSFSILNYSLVDDLPYKGVSYYRLKQTDFDGKISYSELVPVEFKMNDDFSFDIYPNPNNGENLNISINTQKAQEVLVVVYDVTGKKDYSKLIVTSENGENVYAIDPSHKLVPGVYLITATSYQAIYNKKLIVR